MSITLSYRQSYRHTQIFKVGHFGIKKPYIWGAGIVTSPHISQLGKSPIPGRKSYEHVIDIALSITFADHIPNLGNDPYMGVSGGSTPIYGGWRKNAIH
jgi:hypothetical protein